MFQINLIKNYWSKFFFLTNKIFFIVRLLKNKEKYSTQNVLDMKNIMANTNTLNFKAQNNSIFDINENKKSSNELKNEEVWGKKYFLPSKEKTSENFSQKSESKQDFNDSKHSENFGFRFNYNF